MLHRAERADASSLQPTLEISQVIHRAKASAKCLLLMIGALTGCSTGPEPSVVYSDGELSAALEDAMDCAEMSDAEKQNVRDNTTLKNGTATDPRTLAFTNSAGDTITVVGSVVSRHAPPGDPDAVAILTPIICHELYHLHPGLGPAGSGVGGVECRHIGLQLWSANESCTMASSAVNATPPDEDLGKKLCNLANGLTGPLKKKRGHLGKAAIRDCAADPEHSTTEGPPTFGFTYPIEWKCTACDSL